MLIIRRKAGDAILIGDGIEVHIVEVTPTRVKLGIVAPQEVPVIRKEIQLTHEQNLTASRPLGLIELDNFVRLSQRYSPRS